MAGSGKGGFGSGTPSMNGARGPSLEIDMEMEGLDALIARFKQYESGLVLAGEEIAYRVAQDIEEVAKDLVAVDTGKTRMNIVARRGGSDGAMVVATRGGERDEVPAYLELGTYKMAARPFLKPAGQMAMSAGAPQKAVREIGGLLAATGRMK